MKRNIDLTENGDFCVAERLKTFFEIVSPLNANPKIPWTISYSDLCVINGEEEFYHNKIFPTGSVKTIIRYKELSNCESGSLCDCCGTALKFSIFDDRLCKPCYEHLFEKLQIGGWKNIKTEMIPMDYLSSYLNIRSGEGG